MENWLDHLDLPDGQSADLLTRLPYDRAHLIELATERDEAVTQAVLDKIASGASTKVPGDAAWADAVMRAHLWSASVKNYLTGEPVTDISQGSPKIVSRIRLRAVELYMLWLKEVNPAPKDTSGTDSPTRTSEDLPSETPEPA